MKPQKLIFIIIAIGLITSLTASTFLPSQFDLDDQQMENTLSLFTQAGPDEDVLWIGVSAVDQKTVWLSGTGGKVARTINGGREWQLLQVPEAEKLQFRDIHAFDDQRAFILSIGNGTDSRIYYTQDGGESWENQFTNQDTLAFYDCFSFWDDQTGIVMGDAVNGMIPILKTTDGGQNWQMQPDESRPAALEGEGSFAASGTCLATNDKNTVWIGTGASGKGARVLQSDDRGESWVAVEAPVVGNTNASGIASVILSKNGRGMALGGDLAIGDQFTDNVAITNDDGKTWSAGGKMAFKGAVYGSAEIPNTEGGVVAVGPGGAAVSWDFGQSWAQVDTLTYWSVGFAPVTGDNLDENDRPAGWMVGPKGRITKLMLD